MGDVLFKLDEHGKWWRQVEAWEVEAATPDLARPEPLGKNFGKPKTEKAAKTDDKPKPKGRVYTKKMRDEQAKRMRAYWKAKKAAKT